MTMSSPALRAQIVAVLLLGCSSNPGVRDTAPAPPAAPAVVPDGPRLGLYRLDAEHLRPQLIALFGSAEVAEVKSGRAWLVLDDRLSPSALIALDRLELDELRLTRHLNHFKLSWVDHRSRPAFECRAESVERVICTVEVESGRSVELRLVSVGESGEPGEPGLPPPGLYREVLENADRPVTERYHGLAKWLAERGETPAEVRALLEQYAAMPHVAAIDGDRLIFIGPSVSARGDADGSEIELEIKALERRLESRPGGFRARRMEAPDSGFDCDVDGAEIRCREGEIRWRYERKL